MTREEIENSLEYNLQKVQLSVYTMVEREMEMRKLTREQMAEKLGISRWRLNQILNGEFDGKLSQLIYIALKLGYKPDFKFNHPIFTET